MALCKFLIYFSEYLKTHVEYIRRDIITHHEIQNCIVALARVQMCKNIVVVSVLEVI